MEKGWLLNRDALKLAKQCIAILQSHLDIKVRLADPEFLYLLGEYVELLDDKDFTDAVVKLYEFAKEQPNFKVQRLDGIEQQEMVKVQGRQFPRFEDGKEFRNLYRGQPVYA